MSASHILEIAVLVWATLGATGFIDDWTREFDLTLQEIPLIIAVSPMGPLGWLHRMRWPKNRILIKSRRRGQS